MAEKIPRRALLKQGLAISAAAAAGACSIGPRAGGSDGQQNLAKQTAPSGPGLVRKNRTVETLHDTMRGIPTIDTHQHLVPEHERIKRKVDVLTLFSTYCRRDFESTGRPTDPGRDFESTGKSTALDYDDQKIPLEERWKSVAPYLDSIKHLSHYRAPAITMRDLFGVKDLNESNYREVSEKMQAGNTAGLYHRILREKSNIKISLVQPINTPGFIEDMEPKDLLRPIFGSYAAERIHLPEFRQALEKRYDMKLRDLDAYLHAVEKFLIDFHKDGGVALKTYACHWTLVRPDMDKARQLYKKSLGGEPIDKVLEETIRDHVFKMAARHDWTVQTHGGGIYFDFRVFQPTTVIEFIVNHPQTRFDIMHLGYPFAHEIIFIAKQYPNVTLNLTWCFLLSETLGRRCVNEIIDAVPINKVIAFGGDYWGDVENVYGHIELTREEIAKALFERIALGRIDMEESKRIAQLWFHDNPSKIYRLS